MKPLPDNNLPRGLDALVGVLDPQRPVMIQAHDFPDHDAVAAGYGLWVLLGERGIPARFCYSGVIQSPSLEEAIRLLAIPVESGAGLDLPQDTQIILVDGFIGNRNISDIPGTVVALIDHHNPPQDPDLPYWDIRIGCGSCASIIHEYFITAGIPVPRNCATSLLMGILMDTAFMTRGVHPLDLAAFGDLFFRGDWKLGSGLLRNSLSLNDMDVFRSALESRRVWEEFCYIPLGLDCSPEVAALTADFFLNLREIDFVVVLVPKGTGYRLSVRSDDLEKPSDLIIRRALEGVGNGGGHMHMGGGSVDGATFPGHDALMERFKEAIMHFRSRDPDAGMLHSSIHAGTDRTSSDRKDS